MNTAPAPISPALDRTLFTSAIQTVLRARYGSAACAAKVEYSASPLASTFPLADVTAQMPDGRTLELLFKDFSPASVDAAVWASRPDFLNEPLREIEVYRSLLADENLGTAAYYGSMVDEKSGRYWLFLERVAGREMYQVGDFGHWTEVARWLAGFHATLSNRVSRHPVFERLIQYDFDFYRSWMQRAIERAEHRDPSRRTTDAFARIEGCHRHIASELTQLPSTLLHGDFYASNILITDDPNTRVCPVDWERAAFGPGQMDLAALLAGAWSEDQKKAMAQAYHARLCEVREHAQGFSEFWRTVQLCRLQTAIQWLGWSASWSPPESQRQDWLAEALQTSAQLGF